MKKILFIIFAVIVFVSCTEPTVKKEDLPIEVVQLKDLSKFDTVYQIETDKKIYQFNNSKEYLGRYNKEIDHGPTLFLSIVILLLVFIIIIVITSI